MTKPLCIYHGNCADGFAAAWVVRNFFGAENVEFHAGVYQDPPPDLSGRDVIMVDFSYKLDPMKAILSQGSRVLLIDHHKTAHEMIDELTQWTQEVPAVHGRLQIVFDMNRSGAGLAWDFFHPGRKRPALIDHIEDRDLWRFVLPRTRQIQATVFSYPYDFDIWDTLMAADLDALATEGAAIERKHHKDIAELVTVCRRRMIIGGHNVPVASLPYTLSSDAGHLMAQGEPFAACYWDTPAGRVFSLRSAESGLDVSEIAKQYGGGGHRAAAGFRVPFERLSEFEVRHD